eukprot:scaffold18115_cov47-Cyclotella_meneghiniana.AAC.2
MHAHPLRDMSSRRPNHRRSSILRTKAYIQIRSALVLGKIVHESRAISCSGYIRINAANVQCVWKVTLESKSGNVPSIEMANSGSGSFSTLATLNSGNKVSNTDERLLRKNNGLFEGAPEALA